MNIVTFLSDFGLRDGYVGSVKGVVLSNNPKATIIDISHEIKPFQIEEAAYILNSYYSYFPKETVHLAVVDPGVGSRRESIIVKTAQHSFVGPNNGLFSLIYQNEAYKVYRIDEQLLKNKISPTFHGRDIFGPVAAMLSKGVSVTTLAKPFRGKLNEFSVDISENNKKVYAKIISIDRFGNIICNFTKNHFEQIKSKTIKHIKLNNNKINKIHNTYSDVTVGEILALWGSSGLLEISINKGNAAQLFNCNPEQDFIEILFE